MHDTFPDQLLTPLISLWPQNGKPSASDKDGLSKEQRLARDAKVSMGCVAACEGFPIASFRIRY